MKFLGPLSIATATVIYAFFGVLARFVGFTIPIFYQNVTRNIFASLILGIIILTAKKRDWKPMTPYAWKIVMLRAVMGCISFLLFFYTMNHMQIGMAYFLYYGANTVVGYLLGRLLFQEAITKIKWIALILAFFGMSFVYALNFTDISPLLVLATVISGSLCAGWFIIVKKLHDYPGKQLTFLDLLIPTFFYLAATIITKERWIMPELNPMWIASFAYGALFIVTGQLIVYGFHHVEAQIGSLILLGEIPMATVFAYLFYHETVTPLTILGGLLILIAMMLPELKLIKKPRRI